jgi:UDP-3-O-[3-hydroxymyristoyl] N-acetylglucosamine deacetylase / 3-hydroxyacyl-[acyl-carrier-protein] dehydratase
MTDPRQRTLATAVTLEGAGVHTGEATSVTLRPAEPGTGIRFRRTDVPGAPEIPASLDHVVGTDLGTALGTAGVRVLTVEHALAALAAQGVDNALLEVAGPELPIRDGSFQDYFAAIADAGAVEQAERATVITITEPITMSGEGGTSYVATPSDTFRLSATIQFAHPAIGRQFGSFEITPAAFARELGPARTFGFRADADGLRARGLALGASLENTVVLDESGAVLNGGLRFPDEFVRHKAGDIVGDLALLGGRLRGHVVAERPSHKGNVAFAKTIARRVGRKGGAPVLDAAKILKQLPHRYPMLLVDRILEIEPGKRIVGIKNVSINEPYFQGHYPDHPVMPGVLQIEAMAQVGGLLMMDSDATAGKLVYFMTVDNVKWRKPVTPGDQIVFEVELLQLKRNTCRMRGKGTVDGNVVVEGEMMAMLVDPDRP